ncbi:MAG: hypothetical protein LAO78_06510 [Acidobacteriia bacterium]|nr:hypothetical protein [Terriglobia bacterium]
MKNAHLRFGWLTYMKMTEKTTTHFKVRLDRFIGEVLPDPPRQAKAHFLSVFGTDTQIAAISAAVSLGDKFMVEGPDLASIRVGFEKKAESYKGALQVADRQKPIRHLIAISDELATNSSATAGRTLLAGNSPSFIWTSLAQLHGLPGIPDWSDWFVEQLENHQAIIPLLGLGCSPVLVKGDKQQFLSWLARGVKSSVLNFPEQTGPTHWPRLRLDQIMIQPTS